MCKWTVIKILLWTCSVFKFRTDWVRVFEKVCLCTCKYAFLFLNSLTAHKCECMSVSKSVHIHVCICNFKLNAHMSFSIMWAWKSLCTFVRNCGSALLRTCAWIFMWACKRMYVRTCGFKLTSHMRVDTHALVNEYLSECAYVYCKLTARMCLRTRRCVNLQDCVHTCLSAYLHM